MEKIQLKIICGTYKCGEKLPSVRDIANEASVNPNTMQKALTELEKIGLQNEKEKENKLNLIKNKQSELEEKELQFEKYKEVKRKN